MMAPDRRSWRWGLSMFAGAGLVAAHGEPEPFAFGVAAVAVLTGGLILLKGFEQ